MQMVRPCSVLFRLRGRRYRRLRVQRRGRDSVRVHKQADSRPVYDFPDQRPQPQQQPRHHRRRDQCRPYLDADRLLFRPRPETKDARYPDASANRPAWKL